MVSLEPHGQAIDATVDLRLMAKFSEHYSPRIETGEGEWLSKMTEN